MPEGCDAGDGWCAFSLRTRGSGVAARLAAARHADFFFFLPADVKRSDQQVLLTSEPITGPTTAARSISDEEKDGRRAAKGTGRGCSRALGSTRAKELQHYVQQWVSLVSI